MTIPTTTTAIVIAMVANSRLVRRGKPGRNNGNRPQEKMGASRRLR